MALVALDDPRQALVGTIHWLCGQGWCPATSSNFSCRRGDSPGGFWISRSGLDKSALTVNDFLAVTPDAAPVEPALGTPSAETPLHAWVYRMFPDAGVVLHTHSVGATVFSKLYEPAGGFTFSGFEILKAFAGIVSHETPLFVPVFANHQEMALLSQQVDARHAAQPFDHGFLLAGHGLYAWGRDAAEARRHVEAFEMLFACVLELRRHGDVNHS